MGVGGGGYKKHICCEFVGDGVKWFSGNELEEVVETNKGFSR